jgi:hypothetical protein
MEFNSFGAFVDMKYEQNRFNSFLRSNLVRDLAKFKRFASAGFRVFNAGICCYSCQLPLIPGHFDENNVFEHHRTRASACFFILGIADNVPMSAEVSVLNLWKWLFF